MNEQIIFLILAILVFSVALNLKLTFSVLNSLRNLAAAGEIPFTLPIGEAIPVIRAKRLLDGTKVEINKKPNAQVLVFLSSTCPKCREKLLEIERFLPLTAGAGLSISLVSQESKWRLKRFLRSDAMLSIAVRTNKFDYRSLNPTQTSPYYLFLDHETRLEAGGIIGDENWLSFCEQLNDLDSENAE